MNITLLSSDVKQAFQSLADYIGGKAEWFMYAAWNESRFNPQAVNPITTAIGVFQFMPSTLKGLGYTFDQVKSMSLPTQLTTVAKKYLSPYKGRIHSIYDAYLAIFYPYAIGKPDSYIFGSEKSENYAALVSYQNPVFGATGKTVNVYVTKGGVKRTVPVKLLSIADFKRYVDNSAKVIGIEKKTVISTGAIVVGLGLGVWFFSELLNDKKKNGKAAK